jgi:hypothetical protein
MADDVPPALTATQWAQIQESESQRTRVEQKLMTALVRGQAVPDVREPRQALAALLLDRRSFGFTRHDLLALVQTAQVLQHETPELYARLESLAQRLSALLPPV